MPTVSQQGRTQWGSCGDQGKGNSGWCPTLPLLKRRLPRSPHDWRCSLQHLSSAGDISIEPASATSQLLSFGYCKGSTRRDCNALLCLLFLLCKRLFYSCKDSHPGKAAKRSMVTQWASRGKILSNCPSSPKRKRHTNLSIPRRQSPALWNGSSSPQPPPTDKSQAGVGSHATPAISGYCHLSPNGKEQNCTVPSLSHLAICKLAHTGLYCNSEP